MELTFLFKKQSSAGTGKGRPTLSVASVGDSIPWNKAKKYKEKEKKLFHFRSCHPVLYRTKLWNNTRMSFGRLDCGVLYVRTKSAAPTAFNSGAAASS